LAGEKEHVGTGGPAMTGPWILYGANGYTGELVARHAVARGHRPILAGRRADAVSALADELALERRLFSLDEPAHIDAALAGMSLVLHCAGPFSRTSRPMADACLRTGTHYLDVTGEVEVCEALLARDGEARRADVMLLPGCGFEVVPSDCLALHLKERLPGARRLALVYGGFGPLSRGTATTAVTGLGRGGLVRRGGALVPVPIATKTRVVDLGFGRTQVVALPLADLTTAWRSTGIPDVETYFAASPRLRLLLRASRWLGPALASGPVQRFLLARVRTGAPGPSAEERRHGRAYVWGEVEDAEGRRAVSRLRTPDGYTATAHAAVAVVEQVLAGHAPRGFQTPAQAYGAGLGLSLPDVVLTDDEPSVS
jgi:short subunit dehydrogenase-like uncharacterized protein